MKTTREDRLILASSIFQKIENFYDVTKKDTKEKKKEKY